MNKNTYLLKNLELNENIEENEMMLKGYLSTYENIDRYGDVIEKGAFADCDKTEVPMLFNHDSKSVIGKMILNDSDEGLLVEAKFNPEIPLAKEIYSHVKFGSIKSMSVGMIPLDFDLDENNNGFIIKRAEVVEGSIVPIPANNQAEILEVKNLKDEKLRVKELKKQIKEM